MSVLSRLDPLRRGDLIRRVGLVVTLLAAAGFFGVFVHGRFPIQQWLFWRFAGYWATALVWGIACLSLGNELLARFAGLRFAWIERWSLGFAAGVFAFGLAVFGVGLLGGLNVWAFFGLPLLFAAVGARRLVGECRRLRRHLRGRSVTSLHIGAWLVGVVGVAGVGMLYFQALSPEVFSFDVRWYHMPMAQRYALTGHVARFEEGFWFGAYPQLATYLYAWAFLAPGGLLFDKLQICLTLEVLTFIATLAQIPVLLRRLLPGQRVGLTWVVLLLFPGIYLYPSNLHAGADHWAAFWALPIALCLWRAWHRFTGVHVVLFSVFISAAALTKYSALSIVAPPALALSLRGLYLCLRERRREAWAALGLLVVAPLLLTTAHWLKNWLWYGDPMYPMFHRYLNVRPWNPDAAAQFADLLTVAKRAPSNLDGVTQALKTTITFSFLPNNWPFLHRDWPVFGSLFTLTLPCLVFLRGARRLAWLYAAAMSGVFVWYMSNHYDRLLQAVLPWMAAATAGVLVLVWKSGIWPRLALIPLLGLQCVWGGDIPFLRTHNLIHESSVRQSAKFLAAGFEQQPNRLRVFEPLNSIGATLPEDATVLMHDLFRILGIDRNWVADRLQSRLSYGRLLTPRAIHDEFVDLGVTHVYWSPASVNRDSLAGDLAFLRYAADYTVDQHRFGGALLGRVPAEQPTSKATPDSVAVFACQGPYRSGWYELGQLTLFDADKQAPVPTPLSTQLDLRGAFERADFVVLDTTCHKPFAPRPPWVLRGTRGKVQLFIKRSG